MTPGEVARGPGCQASGNTLTAVGPLADTRGLGAVTIAAPPGHRTLLREAWRTDPMFDHSVAEGGLQRRPIPGYEAFYEITRRGDVYSRRLRRFIRQKEWVDGCSHIDVQINKRKHRVPVAAAIAEAFLTPDQMQDVIAAVPDLDGLTPRELVRHPTVEELSDQHNVALEAILSVILRERQTRGR